jgi:ubiquitin-conjugating enzyme E2 C
MSANAQSPSKSQKGQPGDPSSGQLKRLQSELGQLMMAGDPGISAFPGESLLCWVATIIGPPESVYAEKEYKLRITFPSDYPYSSPTIVFQTPIFHPNVDTNGNICLDILQDKWSAIYNVRTVLLSLRSLLADPNNASPLNPLAAQLWGSQEEFAAEVAKCYKTPEEVCG